MESSASSRLVAAFALVAAGSLALAGCKRGAAPEGGPPAGDGGAQEEARDAGAEPGGEEAVVAAPEPGEEPGDASPHPPPATEAQRAILMSTESEPPPEKRTDDRHYVHSNEQHHELYYPYVEGLGGGYVGLASDQNYTIIAKARSEWVWLMDWDTVVNRMHRVCLALVVAAPTAEEYMALWQKDRADDALAAIRERYGDDPEIEEIEKVYRTYRKMTEGYNARMMNRARKGKSGFWLHDEGSYGYIRALFQAGRVRVIRGNLLADGALRGIGEAARALETRIRVVYLSDAESFFHYNTAFRDSFVSLPFDERSVVLRTAAGTVFKVEPADYQWHYNVQQALHFTGLLINNTKFKNVWGAIRRGQPTGTEGLSVTGWEDPTEALVHVGQGDGGGEGTDPDAAPATDPEDLPPECGTPPPTMACVPGGEFVRGADDGDHDAKPEGRIMVSTFWMDRFEVTNARYRECIEAGACQKRERYKGFMGDDQPAVGIDWYNAHAYCEWAGKRLPTEAEWEKAARGPDGDLYPWGDEEPTCALAQSRGCPPQTTLPVGSLPAGHWGIHDMAGNGYEWVQDWWSPCWDGCEDACGAACAGEDPKGPCDGQGKSCPGFKKLKVLRGGSWFWPASQMIGWYRRAYKPASGEHRLSFRCAASPGA